MLINSYRFVPPYDTDAQTYITAVEAADGQALETGIKDAINAFVVGCKNDGIWTAIKASCILAGARTLDGALVPLAGTAPTNNNFVNADYNRKTGLVGNGSNKYLSSNRAGTQQLQNSRHIAVYVSSANSSSSGNYIGMNDGTGSAGSYTFIDTSVPGSLGFGIGASASDIVAGGSGTSTGFIGVSRAAATSYSYRYSFTNADKLSNSIAPVATGAIPVFAYRGISSLSNYTNARLAFYSIGESLNLANLDSRVTALINALAAAIP